MCHSKLITRATLGLVFGLGSSAASAQKMYWTDSAADKIQHANLDGSAVEDLITTGLNNPQGAVS